MSAQQALALELRAPPDLATVHVPAHAPALARALAAVRVRTTGAGHMPLYLHGPAGTGKSHLLLGACAALGQQHRRAHYLPLRTLRAHLPQVVDQVESAPLIAVDEIEALAGHTAAELALFALYDRVRAAGGALLLAGRAAPGALGLVRPELQSRLAWGEVLRLEALDDAGVRAVLIQRAAALGLELPDAVADYLLTRAPRALADQLTVLARLDRAALAAQRRLTVPFVRGVLNGAPAA